MQNLQQIINDPIVQIAGVALAGTFVFCILAEYLLSLWLRKNYVSSHFLIINMVIAFMQQLTDLLNKTLFIFGFMYVQTHWSIHQLFGIPEIASQYTNIPLLLFNFTAIIVVADFCQYWLHRFSHEVNIMWAGHITHHSNTEYNLSVAVRQSALEGIYTWVFFIPLAFFGVPWQMFVLAYTVSLLWQFLVHTRFINRLGFLEMFMSTPSHHRVHHGRNPIYIDKNYGAFFIIWDKLFGTFQAETEEVDYGITRPIENSNPVWTNIHHHIHIVKTAKQASTLGEKLNVIFGRPAFVPANLTSVSVSPITEFSNYTRQAEKRLYVFINFLITAVAGVIAINYLQQQFNLWAYLGVALAVTTSFSIFIGLLENKRWADVAEITRLGVLAAVGLILALGSPYTIPGLLTIITALFLLGFTWYIARRYRLSTSL